MAEDIGLLSPQYLSPTGGAVPLVSGAYQPFLTYSPEYQTYTAPTASGGSATSQYGNNAFAVAPDTPIQVVNNATGEVVFSGTGYDAANQAIAVAQGLTESGGGKANWDIQVVAPGGRGGFQTAASERPDTSALGVIADIGLPIAASLLVPGGGLMGTILPAAGGSALSSVAQGRSLGDTLLRAAIAGGGAGLGEALFPAATIPGSNAPMTGINADLIPNALKDVSFGGIASTSIPAGVGGGAAAAAGSAVDDIIVTALKQVAPNLVSSSLAPSIMSTAPSLLDAIARQYPSYTAPNQQPMTPEPAPDELVVNAQVPPTVPIPTPVPSITGSLLANAAQTALPETGPIDTVKKPSLLDKALGSMSIADYLTLGGIAASGVGSLMGGGGGGAAVQTPYTSPFGAIGGFGAGRDMRANPNIADYERYGFGPEATFFQPQYNQLVSSTFQPAPQAYKPLING